MRDKKPRTIKEILADIKENIEKMENCVIARAHDNDDLPQVVYRKPMYPPVAQRVHLERIKNLGDGEIL